MPAADDIFKVAAAPAPPSPVPVVKSTFASSYVTIFILSAVIVEES